MKRKIFSLLAITLSFLFVLSALASCSARPGGVGDAAVGPLDGNSAGGKDEENADADNGGDNYNGSSGAVGDMTVGGNGNNNENLDSLPGTPVRPDAGEESDKPVESLPLPTIPENPFILTSENNVSTFSADVDTASYTYFRKLINAGYSLDDLRYSASAFRIEEFINYFKYETTAPTGDELFGVKTSVRPTPWNSETHLLSMTLKATEAEAALANNLVFLIDVSGSMMSQDKLPLLKQAFSYLTDNLTANDTVSIVTYSGKEEVVLDGCIGTKKETILEAINSLIASGSTYGEAGLRRAYEIAAKHMIEGGNNRIIMASDGDLNVGITSQEELKAYISEERAKGIYLSVLGFGTGNYRDTTMETLADNGNGVYYYIDGASEAERVLGSELFSTLYTVANDVKLQLTFDPEAVESYRLIGYENRRLNNADFTDDTKDGGEVGSGHCVTVCYEIKLKPMDAAMMRENMITLAVNWKNPGETTSVPPRTYQIGDQDFVYTADADADFRECVMQFCMLLRGSQYLPEGTTIEGILEALQALDLSDYPDREEFVRLIEKLIEN